MSVYPYFDVRDELNVQNNWASTHHSCPNAEYGVSHTCHTLALKTALYRRAQETMY